MPISRKFFITGTGTGIGKSYITAQLIRLVLATPAPTLSHPHRVLAYKPLLSGYSPELAAESDAGTLLTALGRPLTPEAIAEISPYRFTAPLAPSMAAKAENKHIDFAKLVAESQAYGQMPSDYILIEGIGGLLVPLTKKHFVADWIAAINIATINFEIILVCGNYLGSLSHTFTALETLAARKLPLSCLILNESAEQDVSFEDTYAEISHFAPQILGAPVKILTQRRNRALPDFKLSDL